VFNLKPPFLACCKFNIAFCDGGTLETGSFCEDIDPEIAKYIDSVEYVQV